MIPQQTTESFDVDNQQWLASGHGTDNGISITLRCAAFDPASAFIKSGYIRSGVPLSRYSTGPYVGLYYPYDGIADVLAGLLLSPEKLPTDTSVNPFGALFNHGAVIAAKLPIAIDATGQRQIRGVIFR